MNDFKETARGSLGGVVDQQPDVEIIGGHVPLEVQLQSVAVNCASPIRLCHLLAPKMAARGRGGIGLVTHLTGRGHA